MLLRDDKRKEHRDMAAENKNLVKLVIETKQSMKENKDDKTFHDMLGRTLKGCIEKMNDLGEKLGHI